MVVLATTEVVRDESSLASEERAALTEDADAEGARVVLVERAEKKVVLAEAVREVAILEETAALEELLPTENEEESAETEPWEISKE